MAAKRPAYKAIIKQIEAARMRGVPRLKAVADALGLPGPQQPYFRPKRPRS